MTIWVAGAAVLLLPLLAMQITDEVAWSWSDFVLAAALVAGAGVMCELAARMGRNRAYRAAVGVALGTAVMLVWGIGALGIIGSEDNPANLMYAGVLAVGFAGAYVARMQPHGMARALVATAMTQGSVTAVALAAGLGSLTLDTVMVTGLFAALWLTSAGLFQAAARGQASTDALA